MPAAFPFGQPVVGAVRTVHTPRREDDSMRAISTVANAILVFAFVG